MIGPPGTGTGDLLHRAARAIHGERDRDRMVAWAADAFATATAATVAGVALDIDSGPSPWVPAASNQGDLSALGDLRHLPALASVLRGGQASTRDDPQLQRLLGLGSLTLIGIPRHDGGVHGIALLGWRTSELAPAASMTIATSLIAHLGVALDNLEAMADLEAVQRGVVHKLQEAVRPPTPVVPHTELGVYYLAADQQASTGGDLYDWILLPDGELHLAVVDVMGKGVAATKDAVAVTHALRLLVLDGCPLAEVVSRADALVTAQNPDLVVTLIVARYDPRTGRLRLAGGGHPPPLLVTGDEVQQVEVGGIPIGFPGAGSEGEVFVELARSDTVIFYTDGLIESTKDIVKGLEALARSAAETANYPAGPLARTLVDRALAGAVRNDDSLALVLRRRTPPEEIRRTPLAPFQYRFTPSTAAVPLARHFLEDWLVRVPVEPAELADLLLVATELTANAVRHASGGVGSVSLRAAVDGADVLLEVEDDGVPTTVLPLPTDDMPDPLAERGRGLFLVNALVDQLVVDSVEGRTLIRVVRRAIVAVGNDR